MMYLKLWLHLNLDLQFHICLLHLNISQFTIYAKFGNSIRWCQPGPSIIVNSRFTLTSLTLSPCLACPTYYQLVIAQSINIQCGSSSKKKMRSRSNIKRRCEQVNWCQSQRASCFTHSVFNAWLKRIQTFKVLAALILINQIRHPPLLTWSPYHHLSCAPTKT